MNPNAVEASTAGAKIGMVMRSNTPILLLPEVRAASSRAASMAVNAGVSNRNLTEVLKAR